MASYNKRPKLIPKGQDGMQAITMALNKYIASNQAPGSSFNVPLPVYNGSLSTSSLLSQITPEGKYDYSEYGKNRRLIGGFDDFFNAMVKPPEALPKAGDIFPSSETKSTSTTHVPNKTGVGTIAKANATLDKPIGNTGFSIGTLSHMGLNLVDKFTPRAEDKASKAVSGTFNALADVSQFIPGIGTVGSLAFKGLGTLFGAGVKKVAGNKADELVDSSASYTGEDRLDSKRFGILGLGSAKRYKKKVAQRQLERDTAHGILTEGQDDRLAATNVQQYSLADRLDKSAANWMYGIRAGKGGMKVKKMQDGNMLVAKRNTTDIKPVTYPLLEAENALTLEGKQLPGIVIYMKSSPETKRKVTENKQKKEIRSAIYSGQEQFLGSPQTQVVTSLLPVSLELEALENAARAGNAMRRINLNKLIGYVPRYIDEFVRVVKAGLDGLHQTDSSENDLHANLNYVFPNSFFQINRPYKGNWQSGNVAKPTLNAIYFPGINNISASAAIDRKSKGGRMRLKRITSLAKVEAMKASLRASKAVSETAGTSHPAKGESAAEGLEMLKNGGKKDRPMEELVKVAKGQNPRFMQRLEEEPVGIPFTLDGEEHYGSHMMESADDIVYPRIQEVDGKLTWFDDPKEARENALRTGNYVRFGTEDEAIRFAKGYKEFFKDWFDRFDAKYKDGGKLNVIPDGALHARLHGLGDADPDLDGSITRKGIPVITKDKDGGITQHAEIERSEIIFTLEVTEKLEEMRKRYKEGDDGAALEAGKLLAREIMENTKDNTGELINEGDGKRKDV